MALTKVSNSMLVQPVNHNILINPSFTVKQYGDVVDHAGSTASFGPDRWRVRGKDYVGGTKVESSTEVDDATGINKLVVTHEGTTSDHALIWQFIEAVNLQGLYGKEMTFSFGYSDTGGSGIPRVYVGGWDSSTNPEDLHRGIPTPLGNNRWACTFTLSTKDGTIPDPNEIGMQVIIYANSDNGGNLNNAPAKWSVWETKLEAGSVVTPFIARSHGDELALCQRYYQQWGSNDTAVIASGFAYNTADGHYTLTLPVRMRSSPTLLKKGFPKAFRAGQNEITTSLSLAGYKESVRIVAKTNSSFFTTGEGSWLQIDQAGNWLALEAEL